MKKEILNECKIVFPSLSVNEGFARTTAAVFVAQFDPTTAEISEIKTVVSEAVTNSIVHGYPDSAGDIELTLRRLPGSVLYIAVKDRGIGIKDIKQAMTPMFTTAPEEERPGLGFSIMESFMDDIRVKSRVGKGTTVYMLKALKSKVEA